MAFIKNLGEIERMQKETKGNKTFIAGFFVVVACLISIFFFDQKIATVLTQEQADQIYQPARKLTDVGEGDHFFALAIIGYLFSFCFLKLKKNKMDSRKIVQFEKLKSWFLTFFLSLLASGLVVQILKFIIGRQRPHLTVERNPWVFEPFTPNWHLHSFPSGHTQTLFTVATVLSLTFPKWRWWFFGMAGVISITRVLLQEHFFSDLLMGAYVGYAVTLGVFFYRNRQ